MSEAAPFLSLPKAPKSEADRQLVRGRHGFFVILPDDLIIGLSMLIYGECYEHEWQFLKRFIHRDDVIVDAGANLGIFAVPFAHAVGQKGKVIAFEPQPLIFDCLKTTITLNKFTNVELHRACLAEAPGEAKIFEPDYTQPGNFSGVPFREEGFQEIKMSSHRVTAPCVALDDILGEGRLDVLKMDVEGMELDVMRGGKKTIARQKPVIYLENNRREKSPDLIRFLWDQGYKLWWHTGPFFNPHNFTGYKDNIYGKRHNVNMIALTDEADIALLPKSLLPVTSENEHIIDIEGKVTPSFADDVTGM